MKFLITRTTTQGCMGYAETYPQPHPDAKPEVFRHRISELGTFTVWTIEIETVEELLALGKIVIDTEYKNYYMPELKLPKIEIYDCYRE